MSREAGVTLGVMQPYLFPYIGYFQLISCVDRFVVYDHIEYSKGGWFNRNRILQNGEPALFTLPLRKASDFAPVIERALADSFPKERTTLLNRLRACYAKAPQFDAAYGLVERCLGFPDTNLFRFTFNSIQEICRFIGIATTLTPSSALDGEQPALKGQDRVIGLCRLAGADRYINPIGGVGLYDVATFAQHGIALRFLQPRIVPYEQFGGAFVGSLSIIDVLMFNDVASTRALTGHADLL